MTTLSFFKMHGLGNDFVVLNDMSAMLDVSHLPIQDWSDRHLGIGFDQLLVIQPSEKADFFVKIFNSDGTEAEQCGNGMRCVARFVHEQELIHKQTITLETSAGVVDAIIQDYHHIQVSMGVPMVNSHELFTDVQIENQAFKLAILSMGNPHAILCVESIENYPVKKRGQMISSDSFFPVGVNVGFMEIMTRDHIRLRTFERGAGETFACGSNSCAAVVAGILMNKLNSKVTVELQYGDLCVEWKDKQAPVLLTGAASFVFEGQMVI